LKTENNREERRRDDSSNKIHTEQNKIHTEQNLASGKTINVNFIRRKAFYDKRFLVGLQASISKDLLILAANVRFY
jgi:hypothetical protein